MFDHISIRQRRDEADSTVAFTPHNYPRDDAQKTA
jgi:hypothetical protein